MTSKLENENKASRLVVEVTCYNVINYSRGLCFFAPFLLVKILKHNTIFVQIHYPKQELRSKVIDLVVVNILGLSRGQH